MVQLNVVQMFRINSTHVDVKVWSSLDAAADRTVNCKICFHLIGARQIVELRDVIFLVRDSSTVIKTIIIWSRCWRNTISAQVEISALTALQIECGILFT